MTPSFVTSLNQELWKMSALLPLTTLIFTLNRFLCKKCFNSPVLSSTKTRTTGLAIMWRWSGGTIFGSMRALPILLLTIAWNRSRIKSRRFQHMIVDGRSSLWEELQDIERTKSLKLLTLFARQSLTPVSPQLTSIELHIKKDQQLSSN